MFENIVKVRSILIDHPGVIDLFTIPGIRQITETQARDMLAQRGIPEDTLRARLIAKGYDPDNISPNDT